MVQNNNINLKTDLFSKGSKTMDLKASEPTTNKSKFKEVFTREVEKDSTTSKNTKTLETTEDINLEEDKKEIKQSTLNLLAEILNMLNQSKENLSYDETLKLDENIEQIEALVIDLESTSLEEVDMEDLNKNFEIIKKTSDLLSKETKTIENSGKETNSKSIDFETLEISKEIGLDLGKKPNLDIESEENIKPILENMIKLEENHENELSSKKNDSKISIKSDKKNDNLGDKLELTTDKDLLTDEVTTDKPKKDENIHFNTDMTDSKIENFGGKLEVEKSELINLSNVEDLEQEVIKQVVSKLEFNLNEGKNQAIIQLKPEMLGKVKMELEVEKNTIVAKILVDNQKTKEIFENNITSLQEKLEENGMKIKTVEVFVGNNSDFNQNEGKGRFNFQDGQNKKFKSRKNKLEISKNYETGTIDDESMKKEIDLSEGMNLLA